MKKYHLQQVSIVFKILEKYFETNMRSVHVNKNDLKSGDRNTKRCIQKWILLYIFLEMYGVIDNKSQNVE